MQAFAPKRIVKPKSESDGWLNVYLHQLRKYRELAPSRSERATVLLGALSALNKAGYVAMTTENAGRFNIISMQDNAIISHGTLDLAIF